MRKIVVGILVLVLAFAATGCSSKGSVAHDEITTQKDFKAADLAGYICDNIEFEDFLSPVDKDVFLDIYGLSKDMVSDVCAYFSTGATAEEIAVVKAGEDDPEGDLEEISKIFEARLESQKEGFEDYVPEELDKLNAPYIAKAGSSLIMVVCADRDSASKVVSEYFEDQQG